MTTLTAVALASLVMAGLYHFARHVASHIHDTDTRTGRCIVCGLDPQEHS